MDKKVQFLDKIKQAVQLYEPEAKIYLYGSRARASFQADSDWDILILLQQGEITSHIENKITDPLYDIEFETGEVISPIVYSEAEWNTKYKVTSFYNSVMKHSILL